MAHPPYDPYYIPPPPPPHQQHLQPPPAPPAPPPASAPPAAPPQYQHQLENGINTLFVSGLPDDVKPREIHNLFRRKHGFESCQLKYTGRGNQVVAFATFFNHQSAVAAMHELNGVKFDPQTGSVLHIELARSNSRKKRKPGSGAYVVIDKRTKAASAAQETSSADGDTDTDEASPRDNIDSVDKGDLAATNSEKAADPGNGVASVNEQSEKTSEGGMQLCSTLFIANLGPNCTEDELKQALSVYPGFSMLKMRAKGGMPVAFADFEEIEQAGKVMEELQGTMLPSSDRGGMHIEYARSKMRKS
ncbi:RNA-binding protein with multiple splicing [Melia azedarach]|uniref:RNA-binding protein with multiple splicing n=1 Tax=Melia azedarach TaxID=155640 RepID=A0ACC1Y3G8_MELAZ|nr:RNA-binding protein with multiple splicing [Melia azedarach]